MGRGEVDRRRGAVVPLIGLSLVACIVQVVATAAGWDWAGRAQWFAMPLLALALVLAGGLRDPRGRWWLAGLVFSWAGDTLGGNGFLVLLGCFLVAHLCYLVTLWPSRARSVLGTAPMIGYLAVGGTGAALIAPVAGGVLAAPVVVYAAALTMVAVLATAAGRAGVIGGILFMFSDLTLALGIFVIDIPAALQTFLVMGTYVPAQALLLVGVLGQLGSAKDSGSPNAANRSR
ncbi:lysoplasmalogenase [Pseudactinotalea terrae]|uniref:lysoplasmalogenase n=1 Tax=Pseudactinotalea terrae TaxID=1743262 RepID=UPI0013915EB5|nr:lysoplasmalogenase [Pseudactinotalea terrae]